MPGTGAIERHRGGPTLPLPLAFARPLSQAPSHVAQPNDQADPRSRDDGEMLPVSLSPCADACNPTGARPELTASASFGDIGRFSGERRWHKFLRNGSPLFRERCEPVDAHFRREPRRLRYR